MAEPVRVALVDDYSIVLAGLQALLAPHRDRLTVVEVTIARTPHRSVDVTLFDTFGERVDFVSRTRELVADPDAGAVVVFSFSDDPVLVNRVMEAGAHGFITKTAAPDVIVEGILAAARHEPVMITQRSQRGRIEEPITWPGRDEGLTERESEILALLPTGMTNEQIARHLYVSVNTVKTQLRSLYAKLDVRNRVQATAIAHAHVLGEQGRRP
ncbi:MAG TPA: response regulator transcription factor [Acidimicrobiia bacterium]